MAQTFDTYYPSNPWADVATNQREWYDPDLMQMWDQVSTYSKFVTVQHNLFDVRASSMHIDTLIPPHEDIDELTSRQLWLPASHVDSARRTVTFARYGSKLAYHKFDDMITFWKLNGKAGLLRIVRAGLAGQMNGMLDKLARNAFLSGAVGGGFAMYGSGSGDKFNSILAGDTISTPLIDDIHLGMAERGVPYANRVTGDYGNIVCITSPGIIRDLRYELGQGSNDNAFIPSMLYANATRIINNEVGTYHNVRFVQTPRAILYNFGNVVVQPTITAAAAEGAGSPSTAVDGVYTVGQSAATHYLQLDDVTGLAVNDVVTIHVDRVSTNGVTNGPDWNDGKLHNRRIISIDVGNNRISLDLPLMVDFTTDLGSGVYGYVTKAKHVHSCVFIGGSDGVVFGVNQPPRIHTPAPVDDFDSMYRVSWDMYGKYQPFETKVFETLFLGGSNRVKGARIAG